MSVEITQADREAAAQLYIWFPTLSSSVEAAHKTAQLIRDGGADGWNSVRLMRDHRRQAEEAMRERCAEVADQQYAGTPGWSGHYKNAGTCIATAIRSMEVE